jgi:CxxC-x17-CxxC domain-containing protein
MTLYPGVRDQVYTDETLTCVDCNAQFTFSAGEQEFFAAKGFTNKPNRCPDCRAARKAQRSASGGGGYSGGGGGGYGGGSRPQREMFTVTCSQCGQAATVPFQPRGDKPVYCRDCFQSRSGSYR